MKRFRNRHCFFLLLLKASSIFPFTKTGVVFLSLSAIAAGVYGIRRMDFVMLAVGLAGALAILVLLLCTLACAAALFFASRRAVTPGALVLETNMMQPTGYRVRCPGWIPCITARWVWEGGGCADAAVSAEREKGRLAEAVSPARRCLSGQAVRRFSVRDMLGLTEISWRRAETVNLQVLPNRGLLAQMPSLSGVSGGEGEPDPWASPCGDRTDIRPYVPGDSLRMALWKLYARSGKMMVRVPERSVSEHRRGCGYLVVGEGDEAAAAMARVAVERGMLGEGWRFGADGVNQYAAGTDEALKAIALSGDTGIEGRKSGLGDFLARMQGDGYRSCILFMPPDPGAWDYAARQMDCGGAMRIHAVIGVEKVMPERDGVTGFARRAAGWFLLPDAEGAEPTLEEIRQMVSRAPGLCRTVSVAERQTGNLHQAPAPF